jgi:N6-adenosine-specific RNA methylase IME4
MTRPNASSEHARVRAEGAERAAAPQEADGRRFRGAPAGLLELPYVRGGWACILADPPWRFSNRVTRAAAERHYATMSGAEIANMPVGQAAARDAVLGLWVPDTHLELAIAVSKAWGFTYRHLYPWTKVKDGKLQIGLGNLMRKCHEVALICTRGSPVILDRGVPSACIAPRTRHSAKPTNLHAALERLCAGPRLELFARDARAGWTAWGLEAPPAEGTG